MIATLVNFVTSKSELLLSVPEPMSVLFLGLVMIVLSESLRSRMRRQAAAGGMGVASLDAEQVADDTKTASLVAG